MSSRKTRRFRRALGAATFAALAALPACQWEIFGGRDTFSPAVEVPDYAQMKIDAGGRRVSVWRAPQENPGSAAVESFCQDLLRAANSGGASGQPTVACLPLVTYELRSSKSFVSELGVVTAEDVAMSLRQNSNSGYSVRALDPGEIGVRLAQANLSRASLSTLEGAASGAGRLGADVIVFGTIERRDRVVELYRDVLTFKLQAYSAHTGGLVGSSRWEVPSDNMAYQQVWDLAQAESSWMPDSRWGVPSATPTLLAELDQVSFELAETLARQAGGPAQGALYVAPLDASPFVAALAHLKAARISFAAESERRRAAATADAPMDMTTPVTLDGAEFPNLQAAEDYLVTLGASLEATDAARFGESFSTKLGLQLAQSLRPAGGVVRELPGGADGLLVAGALAQGSLVANPKAAETLQKAGVQLVATPRLDRVGDARQLRVELVDVKTARLLATASAGIPPEMVSELDSTLHVSVVRPETGGAGSKGPTSQAWNEVYSTARTGVVHVVGPDGRGTGFLAGNGVVLTNDHVVRGCGAPLTIVAEGGQPLPAQVLGEDDYWDLAALKTSGLPRDAHVFEFAPAVQVGDEVAVLGHPRDSSGWVLTPGFISSVTERLETPDGRGRPSVMYTCPTRQGSSGSPVLLHDGRVAAVHFGGRVGQSLSGGSETSELTGFALGVPGSEAHAFLQRVVQP